MDSATVADRDKKIIIWNFMEELWENYQNAVKNKLETQSKFMDFYKLNISKRQGRGFAGENRGGHLERVWKRNWKY